MNEPTASRRPLLLRTGGMLAVWCLSACSAPPATPDADPAVVVEGWYSALAEDRPGEAWELLADEAREGMDRAAFVAMARRQRDALLAQAERVRERVRTRPASERAVVRLGADRVELVRTREGWRVVAVTPMGSTPSESAP